MTLSAEEIATSSFTHTGTVRQRNEDAILAMPSSGLWAVADGMGGHQAGDYASQCIIEHLQRAGEQAKGAALVEAVTEALNAANLEIFNYSQGAEHSIVGSTVTVLVMEGEHYHCFWCGDSRCYILRDDQFVALTQDHTEAQEMVANGELSPELADSVPEANVLTNAIGIGPEVSIDYVKDYIYEQDVFLLCTDGLNKVFSDGHLRETLLSGGDVEAINQGWLAQSLKEGAPDNISSIIVSL